MSRTVDRLDLLVLDTPDGDLTDLTSAFQDVVGKGLRITRSTSIEDTLKRIAAGFGWDLAVVDCLLGDGAADGWRVLTDIRGHCPDMPVVAVAQHGDVRNAGLAVQAGATDFLVRSGDLADRVTTLLKKLAPHLALINRNRMLREQNMLLRTRTEDRYRLVWEAAPMAAVMDKVARVAAIPRPVLIVGERGTGKELVARAIHHASGNGGRPMVVINCAAFTDTLLETELFGHEKGAYTGADSQASGKFELAAGGSLFLDEIGHMSLSFQQKILRVVEYGTFNRVGGNREIRVDTRIMAATNADLKAQMADGRFLPDLYDRLSFETITVPPLRERKGDIALLARHFLARFMEEIPALGGKRLSAAALGVLDAYPFPGNVRELKNIIERAAYRDITNEITPVDLEMPSQHRPSAAGKGFAQQVEAFKAHLIRDAFEAAGGNQAAAARRLGLSYHQYRYFLRKYGTQEPPESTPALSPEGT